MEIRYLHFRFLKNARAKYLCEGEIETFMHAAKNCTAMDAHEENQQRKRLRCLIY